MSRQVAPTRRRWIILLVALAILLPPIGFFTIKWLKQRERRSPPPAASFLDQVLGVERIVGIDEDGFHATEKSNSWSGENYRWTNGAAKLVVPLGDRRPQTLYVRLGLHIPRTVRLGLRVNGQQLVDESVPLRDDWARTFDLSTLSLGNEMVLEILSDVVIPREAYKGNTDGRSLGVCVRGVMLLRDDKEFVDVPLGVRCVPGVLEEGFSWQEKVGEQPCRWTVGTAKLTVPIRGKTPKSLALTLQMPPNQPQYRVQVSVNGRSLFDDEVKPRGDWSAEFPLADVDLGSNARIEVVSSTFVPAETIPGSTDKRKLGVRVKKMVLVHQPPAEAK